MIERGLADNFEVLRNFTELFSFEFYTVSVLLTAGLKISLQKGVQKDALTYQLSEYIKVKGTCTFRYL